MFVLLARDRHAALLVRIWALLRADNPADEEQVLEAIQCATAMDKWRHESKGITPGENFASDPRFEKLLLSASDGVDEHPDGFDYSCQCNTCLSYGE